VWVTVQLPVPPDVVHGLPPIEPGPVAIEALIWVPFGALTQPVPSLTWAVKVKVCVCPTRLTPFGVIATRASTTLSGSHGPSDGA
jgi:hypothetical protein